MENENAIKHLAFIMDGNRRWAKKNNKSVSDGHKVGLKTMGEIVEPLFNKGIGVISVYAFSLDNWNRDSSEVQFLHNLISEFYHKELPKYQNKDIRVCISGVNDMLSEATLGYLEKIQQETKNSQKGIFNICFNYGGRREIVEAAKAIARGAILNNDIIDEIDIQSFKDYLFVPNLPDVDFVIRTSGEYRVSDFLIYQSSYAEYYFTDTLWPDLTLQEVYKAIDIFSSRVRKFGGNL